MYTILILRQDSLYLAYNVIRVVALPMIMFTAVGTALCSLVIRKLTGEQSDLGLGLTEDNLPLSTLIQRVMLLVTVILFLFNYMITWQFHTRMARDNALVTINELCFNAEQTYLQSGGNTDILAGHLCEQYDDDYIFLLREGYSVRMFSGGKEIPIDPKDARFFREQAGEESFTVSLKSFDEIQVLGNRSVIDDSVSVSVMCNTERVYLERDNQVIESTLSDILLFAVFYVLVVILAERLVVANLKRVNDSLGKITAGNVNEEVWVRTSSEFSELSDDINQTVSTLRGYIHDAENKMKNELKLAASIQDSALPKNFHLPYGNLDLYAMMVPARDVGGDFYDFFSISSSKLCLVIADVSGKGVPASLFMMRAKTSIKYFARNGNSPAELLANVNNALCEDNDTDMFVTVWLGILDLDTGLMRCANAGHEYPVLMRSEGEYELLKKKHSLMLATYENIVVNEYEIQFAPGDRLFVYTDGVPEAVNEKNEQYGTARMTEQLNKLKNRDQQHMLEGMLQDIRNYSGTAEQFDDITMLGFTFNL